MLRGIDTAILAGAITFSGIGSTPQPARISENPIKPRIETVTSMASPSKTETPEPTFNQEAYIPNEEDATFISDISRFFLETASNPVFYQEMIDRYYGDFGTYFDIYKAPNEFGFKYTPFGIDNPVMINFYAREDKDTDINGEELTHTINTLYLTVDDDGTIFTPREDVDSFPLEYLPEIVEANFITLGMEGLEWQSNTTDPMRQIIFKEVVTPLTSYSIAGDTLGNLFLNTESTLPTSIDEQ